MIRGLEFGIKFNMTPVWWGGRHSIPADVGVVVMTILAKWSDAEVRVSDAGIRVSRRFPPEATVAAIQRQATELRTALDRITNRVPEPVLK